MTPDRESRIERICQAALEREGSARAAFLAEACAGDASLHREVASLLAQESAAAGFMSTPAAAFASGTGGGTSFIGRQLGPYVIHSRLGAGGMGEVYRAHDTKLGRDVAIKVLPRIFTNDPGRLARFEREARLLASLNHPNIGAIYGLEDVDGVPSLVLELVEGETLAERLTHGPLSIPDALTIAGQIAAALEAAHERGIVHRDLKPANIVLHDLAVKVLDFGLAKAMVGDASGPDLSQSPTITIGGTNEGIILGTAAYMSPGQARGRPVDKRADVWAFGCVLYEMLTGRLAFPGDTLSDTIVAVLQGEPGWMALPGTTPAGIQRMLRRCLEKDPARRLRDIGDVRLDIEEALTAPAQPRIAQSFRGRRWPTRMAWAIAAGSIAAAIGALALPSLRARRVSEAQAFRFVLPPSQNARLPADRPNAGILALSHDGRRLAFVAARDRTVRLWVHSLDALDAQPLPDTDGAEFPIWSSDNRTVAFGANGKLKVIDVAGGTARTLCDIEGALYGGSWTPDGGRIVFATLQRGLVSVAVRDGLMTSLSNRDATSAETDLFPTILPDGRHFIYLSMPSKVAWLGTLDSKEMPVRLLNTDSQVQYVEPGYLVFVRRGMLMAQRFDAQRTALIGEAAQIVDGGVRSGNQSYSAAFATSLNGVLVYLKDPLTVSTQLTWVDRSGRLSGLAGNPGRYRNPELSPDGASVVLEVLDAQESGSPDVWRLDLARGVMTPLTSDPRDDVFPIWSPDGQWIMFGSDRDGGVLQLYRMRADGTGGVERVLQSPTAMLPQSWADRQPLIYQSRPAFNLGLLPLTGGAAPHLFDPSKAFQGFGQVSPTGQWLAYASTDAAPGSCAPATTSGRCWNIYVQSFPRPDLGRWRISKDGGASPRWGRDGREIFYYAQDGRLMAVPVTSSGTALEVGAAVPLFQASLLSGPQPLTSFKQQYDVASDGRFLLNRPVEDVTDEAFTVVVNWPAGLTR